MWELLEKFTFSQFNILQTKCMLSKVTTFGHADA